MLSLTSRLLLAGALTLSAFLGLTGYALDQAFQRSAKQSVEDRLLGQVMALIAAAQVHLDGTIKIPSNLPITLFNQLENEFYAKIVDEDGNVTWSSPTMGDKDFNAIRLNKITEIRLTETSDTFGEPLFNLSYGVTWDTVNNYPIYTINIAETKDTYNQEISHFRNLLFLWLGGVSILLLITQWLVFRWSLTPLRRAVDEIVNIEQGEQTSLEGSYPSELQSLTTNINALIRSNKEHLSRHRNALSDLAHSLKTPLAIMRAAAINDKDYSNLKQAITEEVDQMQGIIDYQLQRAATSGRIPLTKPVAVSKVVHKITQSLVKVYAEKHIQCDVKIKNSALFFGDESDLFEVLGNLIDNAFKWCKNKVYIKVSSKKHDNKRLLIIRVEDNGPGIDKDIADKILERGVKSSKKQGTGIGLAIVKDIVEAYEGELSIEQSTLGGASFILTFSNHR
ncbi:MAG: ATP-binding protein [Gammaproteobacteria bacterium]|nr:ATP-binding protein [Gammaproteobacteria bacterium]